MYCPSIRSRSTFSTGGGSGRWKILAGEEDQKTFLIYFVIVTEPSIKRAYFE